MRKHTKQLQKNYKPIVPYVLPFSFEKILGASRLHHLAHLRITFYVFHVQRHAQKSRLKISHLQFNTVGRWDDGMIVPPSDGPMIIWIDWE